MTRTQRRASRNLKRFARQGFYWERPSKRPCETGCTCKACRTTNKLLEQLRQRERGVEGRTTIYNPLHT